MGGAVIQTKYRGFVWKWVHSIAAKFLRELLCSHLLITKQDNHLDQSER